ncbi:zinc metalloprotease HtpX [Desmospora profundinema]|uniref:Protease HtpX homolog n=1 Tax=Desmospora profundinema TaxID=1571184 RepID=A0ABU1IPD4_9BACL|nr:zinc metalloprotease HtpX [Desmospora profundinema]MDR6226387.1 heat shock protein HtpX [Desmospora profundinema]
MLLHQQIESNKRKTVLIVTGFILFVLLVGASVSYIQMGEPLWGATFAGLLAIGYTLFMVLSSTRVVMAMNHAQEVKQKEDHPFLWHTVEGLAMAARVPTPRIFIIQDPSPNAFATGISPKDGAVAVTTGLMDRLNREEVEAVLAHEVAHIKNYDIRLATIALALVSVIAILSDFGSRILFWGRRERNVHPIVYVVALVLLFLSPFIATIIRLAISRNREYLADASGAELCRNPYALASALEKIAGVREPVKEASNASAMLYFSDPLKKKMTGLFSTHPPAEERIRRLRGM